MLIQLVFNPMYVTAKGSFRTSNYLIGGINLGRGDKEINPGMKHQRLVTMVASK